MSVCAKQTLGRGCGGCRPQPCGHAHAKKAREQGTRRVHADTWHLAEATTEDTFKRCRKSSKDAADEASVGARAVNLSRCLSCSQSPTEGQPARRLADLKEKKKWI